MAEISLPPDNTHTHTSLLSRPLLVNTFDNYNLHCICYNWLLSLETVGSEPLFAALRDRKTQTLITPRQEKHRTLKQGQLPRCAFPLVSAAINKVSLNQRDISVATINISGCETAILHWCVKLGIHSPLGPPMR